jgi:hypothetical protein
MKRLLVLAGALLVAGCASDKQDASHPPEANVDRTAPVHVIAMPDGFPNVVMKCDGRGNMVYVTSHTGGHDAALVIKPDERC